MRFGTVCLLLCALVVCGCSKVVWVRGGVGRDAELSVRRDAALGRYAAITVAPAVVNIESATPALSDLANELALHTQLEVARALGGTRLFESVATDGGAGGPELIARLSLDFGSRKTASGFDAGHTSLDALIEILVPGDAEPVATFEAVGLGISSYNAAAGPKADISAVADRFALELARYASRHGRRWGKPRPAAVTEDIHE